MPAGVSWSTYLRFATVAMLTMMAGSQTVHMIYRPLDVSHTEDILKVVEHISNTLVLKHLVCLVLEVCLVIWCIYNYCHISLSNSTYNIVLK